MQLVEMEWRQFLLAALMVLSVAFIYRGAFFIWSVPPLPIAVAAVVTLLLGIRRVPVAASLFLLAGAVTLSWSLAPANTLVNVVWESLYLAALVAAAWLPAFVAINIALLWLGLEQTLLLDVFGLTQHFSGSIHYVAGAQGLLFLPVCLYLAIKSNYRLSRLLYLLGAGLALFLALNSGARAVYLPLLLIGPFLLWRVLRASSDKPLILQAVMVPLAVALAVSAMVHRSPMPPTLVVRALPATVSALREPPAPTTDADGTPQVEDGLRSRVKMWEQAIHIGLERPLGTGAGTFREIVHAFQLYPSIGFSSAHNVFLEVFATGGLLRVVILLALLIPALWFGWLGDGWGYALGAAAIWMTLSFDVTAQMPAVMAMAFASLGPLYSRMEAKAPRRRALVGSTTLTAALVSIAAVVWWYAPCEGSRCLVERHLGFRPYVRAGLPAVEPAERQELMRRVVDLNPDSLWAWQASFEASTELEERLAFAEEIASRFPNASPTVFLQWAELALAADRPDLAGRIVRTGLEHFPAGHRPAGVPLVSRGDQQAEWLQRAQEILGRVRAQ